MLITKPGKDIINISEKDYDNNYIKTKSKIHLIKLSFKTPTFEKIDWVVKNYSHTNRYIISDNIRIYNEYFKRTNKKYYVENNRRCELISFFRKNNKVLLNLTNLSSYEYKYIMNESVFEDVLKNIEIIQLYSDDYRCMGYLLKKWKGNVIIIDNYFYE